MKLFLLTLLFTGVYIHAAQQSPDPGYFVCHVGYYDSSPILPVLIATNALSYHGHTFIASGASAKKCLIISCILAAGIMLYKYRGTPKKKRRRFCFKCLCDLQIWEIVDPKKIVEPVDCYVCSIPD